MWQFWIDRGGTFTDIIARDPDGRLIQAKFLSENPEQYPDAALAGIRAVLGLAPDAPLPEATIASVKMGTTVGTNALLTRSGATTLLVTTEGFADLLEIGDQARPDIFALNIAKPVPLHSRVVEARERMDARGHVLLPLDLEHLAERLTRALEDGLASCAIAFMHSWKNPCHEEQAGALARRLGFRHVTLSHQASPLVKFLPRAETAVLDATLSPPLRHYVEQVASALPSDCRLEFMQSNGGLVPAAAFQGKDSVLSGPAGGLMGMIKCGLAAGHHKLIGFDMGGTSTDVSLYAGRLERQAETRVAGTRVRVPMLGVHTVAAGGGSILHFDGQRLTVGPDSAGSLPGPVAYRRGGPLAVTDANLLLGRIQADHFPAVFGPDGRAPLDLDAVGQAFDDLTERVNQALGLDYDAPRLAEGFLDIAVENMADAVRYITLERGVNPADFTLISFGGAGGQHACRIAQKLGMSEILISPYAGVLSAWGIGLAERRELTQTAMECPLEQALLRLPAEPETTDGSRVERRALLRHAGSDTVIAVPLAELETMTAEFHRQHQARFGFADSSRPLVCVALEAERISGGEAPRPLADLPSRPGRPLESRQVYFNGQWLATGLYRRNDLMPGQRIPGPALVLEAASCTVLEPGWSLTLTQAGDLLLTLDSMRRVSPDPSHPDPTWLTLFNRRFMSIAEDMGRILQNSARSVNVRERLDFSCALFDAAGQLVANAPHIPVHLGSMGDAVRGVADKFGPAFKPGDAYLINSPYAGGTHLPDITVVMPVFDPEGRALRYFTAARAHHADIGGISPGSMPADSTRISQEGCLSDGLLILSQGRLLEADVRHWLAGATPPARNPDQNLADLNAQLAACILGVSRLRELEQETGAQAVSAYMGFVQDQAEAAVHRLLGKLRDGQFSLEMDDGSQIRVAIHIQREELRAVIDFAGTTAAVAGNLNAPASISHSAVLYVFRTLLDMDIPLNAGVLRPLDVRLPPGSLLNPTPPAAVVAGNVETSQNIVDALYGALGALAASQGTMNNFSFGDGVHQYYETLCGGTGAGPGFPGASAVHSHMTNSRLTDPEVLELNYPVRVDAFGIRKGSGGSGLHPGGDGVYRHLRFLAPMSANLIASRRRIPPFGLLGGQPGAPGRQWIEHPDGTQTTLAGRAAFHLAPGDVLVIETPGGGGYGNVGLVAADIAAD